MRHGILILSVAGLVTVMFPPLTQAALILEYKFNEAGVTASSAGGVTTALALKEPSGTPADLHTAGGTGVSGLPYDRAISGGYGDAGDVDAVDGLMSFTLSGWFKRTVDYQTTWFDFWDAQPYVGYDGFAVGIYMDMSFSVFKSGHGVANMSTDTVYMDVDAWVFFALTFDGSTPSDNVRFYKGTTQSPVTLVRMTSLSWGQLGVNSGPFLARILGDSSSGYLDNLRVHGSAADGTGAQSLSDLEGMRHADVVPEPTSVLTATMGMLLILLWERIRLGHHR